MSESTRLEGERTRVAASIGRLRDFLEAIERDVKLSKRTPIGIYTAQGMVQTATDLAMQLAKMDAYQRAEDDSNSKAGGEAK